MEVEEEPPSRGIPSPPSLAPKESIYRCSCVVLSIRPSGASKTRWEVQWWLKKCPKIWTPRILGSHKMTVVQRKMATGHKAWCHPIMSFFFSRRWTSSKKWCHGREEMISRLDVAPSWRHFFQKPPYLLQCYLCFSSIFFLLFLHRQTMSKCLLKIDDINLQRI